MQQVTHVMSFKVSQPITFAGVPILIMKFNLIQTHCNHHAHFQTCSSPFNSLSVQQQAARVAVKCTKCVKDSVEQLEGT